MRALVSFHAIAPNIALLPLPLFLLRSLSTIGGFAGGVLLGLSSPLLCYPIGLGLRLAAGTGSGATSAVARFVLRAGFTPSTTPKHGVVASFGRCRC